MARTATFGDDKDQAEAFGSRASALLGAWLA
jgi:hypothetical protein